ncbi:MAG: ABC transporter ATP-binding protein [Anaerolineae bacterium]
MITQPAIEVVDLYRAYGELMAVEGVTLRAQAGEVLALLGPNGAGKSTLISVLAGLLAPTAGDARIMGHSVTADSEAARASLGVVPQDIALYPDLSARENLLFWGKMYGLRGAALHARVDEVLELIGLTDRQRDRVSKYSGGMKRRVNIGVGLLHKPPVIIMDEPTVGIDPQSRRHILDNVRQLNADGMTVLYTTHYMEEAAELADHIAIMDQGKVIAYGTHDELVRLVGGQTRVDLTLSTLAEAVLEAWRTVEGVSRVDSIPSEDAGDGTVTALVDDSNRVLPRLFEAATAQGVRITSVDIREPNLEMVFLHLTGRALRD